MVSQYRRPPPAYSEVNLPSVAPSAPPATSAPRASSVISGRSHTRRHRHARSHHGGSSAHLPQNDFPIFSHSGDVEIVIATEDGRKENKYVLHRQTLCQCSAFFEASTRVEWSSQRNPETPSAGGLARINENGGSRASSQERRPAIPFETHGRKRWRYVLDWQNASDEDPPMLVQKDNETASIFGSSGGQPDQRAPPPPANESFFRSMRSLVSGDDTRSQAGAAPLLEPGEEILKDYDNLFRTMYQRRPILDSINIASAYTECKALLHLADMYDALDIVGDRVDHHLLCFGAKLFKQIARYPPSYLKLGYLARSQKIFTEALVHVVGQWPAAAPQLRNHVDANVMDLIEDKVEELEDDQTRVEAKLWRLTLTTSRGDRVTPSNDFLSWLAMSLFRQWFAENTTPGTTNLLKDTTRSGTANAIPHRSSTRDHTSTRAGSRSSNHIASQRVPVPTTPAVQTSLASSGRVYNVLGSNSSSSYLGHDEAKRFLKLQPDLYTRDNLRKFERRLDDLKYLARDAVKPLMRNFLELDLSSFGPNGLGYLTCTRLDARDLPWDE